MTISTLQKLPQCTTSPVWMDWLCLEDRAQCLGFLLLLENREIVQYIKYWGLNHFSGSYASAMAGAAAGGEQNKAQPSNSSQRNRNSKCNIFYLNAEICSYLLKFVLKLLGTGISMTEGPLIGREKM